jgi:tetratricopeptide (TPR) repeat protein|tara:strand:+ start:1389 stop:2519 length:1131 start_codon:yes stop_codon:yes gene_type:complete
MKFYFIFIFALPLFSFSQVCNYTDANNLLKSECEVSFSNRDTDVDVNMERALDEILIVSGLAKRFFLMECSAIKNLAAFTPPNGWQRYLLYNKDWIKKTYSDNNYYHHLSILAHEVGHHLNGHTLVSNGTSIEKLQESRTMELEADYFSGSIMFKLGASLMESQEAILRVSNNSDDTYSSHPSRDKRLKAIEDGYNDANAKDSGNNTPFANPLTYTDYIYSATHYFDQGKNELAISHYSKSLNLLENDESWGGAWDKLLYIPFIYEYRAQAHYLLGSYNEAINDLNKIVEFEGNDEAANNPDVLYYIALCYDELGNYNKALTQYTKVIKMQSDYADAYYNRGLIKSKLGLSYCSDFRKGCDYNSQNSCELFNKYCR